MNTKLRWVPLLSSLLLVAAGFGCASAPALPDPARPDDEPHTSAPVVAASALPPPPKPAGADDPCRASKEIRLELLAEQLPGGVAMARIGLHNIGPVPVCVLTHVATHEWQHDWLEVEIPTGGQARSLVFNDARDKSGFVIETVAPGATDWQEVDLAAWARRVRNGSLPLSKGRVAARVIYDTTQATDAWAGRLETTLRLDVQ